MTRNLFDRGRVGRVGSTWVDRHPAVDVFLWLCISQPVVCRHAKNLQSWYKKTKELFTELKLKQNAINVCVGKEGKVGEEGGLFTWTGAGGVEGELLCWEQEHDLQPRDRQQGALVGEIQEVKTCEGDGVMNVFMMFFEWQLDYVTSFDEALFGIHMFSLPRDHHLLDTIIRYCGSVRYSIIHLVDFIYLWIIIMPSV